MKPILDKTLPVSVAQTKAEPNFTHTAIGVCKSAKTGAWCVSVVKYDPATGVADTEVTEIPAGESRDFAIEKFKLEAVEREIIG